MTNFELNTLQTLLEMYSKELKHNGIEFHGQKAPQELVNEYVEKVEEVWATLVNSRK